MYIDDRPPNHEKRNKIVAVILVVALSVVTFVLLSTVVDGMRSSTAPTVNKTITGLNATTQIAPTTTVTEPKPEPVVKRLAVNEIVATTDGRSFVYFYKSTCFYAGKVHVDGHGDWANFNVLGRENGYGITGYSFTVHDGGTFVLYGVTYTVSFDRYPNTDVILTEVLP